MRRATSGFTLLEMMIVIAIIGVVAAVGLPSFRYLTSTTKVKGASTELYLAMIRARNEAVKRNRLVSVIRNDAGWQAGWQIVADSNNDRAFTSADRVLNETGAQSRVTITSADNRFVFMSSGRILPPDSPPFTPWFPRLEVTSGETSSMKRCITTDLTGRPYTKEGACL